MSNKVLYAVFELLDLVRVIKIVKGVFTGQKGNKQSVIICL